MILLSLLYNYVLRCSLGIFFRLIMCEISGSAKTAELPLPSSVLFLLILEQLLMSFVVIWSNVFQIW